MVLAAAIHLSTSACDDVGVTTFGNPNTLDRKNLPGEGGAEPLSCAGEAGVGGMFDGGCPSFATDIFPYFRADGKWKCADTKCHAGATAPPIDGTDPAKCLANLRDISVGGRGYIVAGDGGSNASTLLCNLQGSCGSKMPKPPGVDPTATELCMLEAWLNCGAK